MSWFPYVNCTCTAQIKCLRRYPEILSKYSIARCVSHYLYSHIPPIYVICVQISTHRTCLKTEAGVRIHATNPKHPTLCLHPSFFSVTGNHHIVTTTVQNVTLTTAHYIYMGSYSNYHDTSCFVQLFMLQKKYCGIPSTHDMYV